MASSTPVDRERLRRSLGRLWEIYREIGVTAGEVSRRRCPYKDREDRCTARFGCRNQLFPESRGQRPLCAGDDRLDYRQAWESE